MAGSVRNAMPLGVWFTIVLMLPALGIALVKPCVVEPKRVASKENVRRSATPFTTRW